MKFIKLVLIFSLTLFFNTSFGQKYSTTNKKAIKLYEEGQGLIHNRDFKNGIILIKQAIEKDPNFTEAYAGLGGIYRSIGDFENAKPYLIKAAALKPNAPEYLSIYQSVGDFYLIDGDYANAKKYFEMIIALKPDKKNIIELAERRLKSCTRALELMAHPIPFKPVPLSDTINQFYINGYPSLTADQQTLIYYKTDGMKRGDEGDIMISKKINGKWSIPVSISNTINTKFDEGACTMSADGKVLVFASCHRKDVIGACDLYISYKKGNDWTAPVNMGSQVNSIGWDSEASLSADGKTLYFSSERSGGFGKEDIWMTQMNESGEWSKATNLGNTINTPGRDLTPFIHADAETFYFCSDYHPGMGQLDIFISKKLESGWSTPRNLGYPINTNLNDVSLFLTPDNKKGLYMKYEKKGITYGRSKIYEFDVPKEIIGEKKSTYAKGTVYDAETKAKLGSKIELIDLQSNKVVHSVNSDSINGDYILTLTEGKEYALYVQNKGYLFKSTFFDYKNPANFDPLVLDVYLDPVKSGKAVVLNNIFYASNSYKLEDKSKTELDKIILFLKTNSKVSIEFGGHTDDVGSDKDNIDLSLKRAKSVYEYLVTKGIPAARLKYKGYGESKPLKPNTSDENRQLNRRIEFKVL